MAKEFRWQGMSEEELKRLDIKKFLELIPSRQRRSLQRSMSFPLQQKVLKAIQTGDKNIRTHCREMIIIPTMLGCNLKIYNGKEFMPIMITADMVGHRLGEFAPTRRTVTHSAAGIGATRSSKAVSAR